MAAIVSEVVNEAVEGMTVGAAHNVDDCQEDRPGLILGFKISTFAKYVMVIANGIRTSAMMML